MIIRERHGEIEVIRLAHGKASVLDTEFLGAIERALTDLGGARAVVLTGTGSIFSAGVDLYRMLEGGEAYIRSFLPALDSAIRRLFELPVPVVAAVNGHAIAGGCILVEACDYRIMSGGRIGAPELLVGVPFPVTALEVIRFAVATQHVQKLVYTGCTLQPDEALSHGLIDEVATSTLLLDRAIEIATSLAAIPSETFLYAKRLIRQPVLDRIAALEPRLGADILKQWLDPRTAAVIRAYLDRTITKK